MGKASFSRLCTRKNVLHIRGRPSSFPLYIYREREREMGSSYTRCNSCQVTPFLHHRFLKDLTVKKDIIKCYCFPLLSLSLFIVFHLIKGPLTFSTTYFSNEPLNSLHPTHILLLLLFSLSLSRPLWTHLLLLYWNFCCSFHLSMRWEVWPWFFFWQR